MESALRSARRCCRMQGGNTALLGNASVAAVDDTGFGSAISPAEAEALCRVGVFWIFANPPCGTWLHAGRTPCGPPSWRVGGLAPATAFFAAAGLLVHRLPCALFGRLLRLAPLFVALLDVFGLPFLLVGVFRFGSLCHGRNFAAAMPMARSPRPLFSERSHARKEGGFLAARNALCMNPAPQEANCGG